MKKLILSLMFAILLISLASAVTDTASVDDVFQVKKMYNYAKPCFNNGTYCSASAACNYTIFRPDNTKLVNNELAINSFTNHNINVTFDEIGLYKIDMICKDAGLKGSETFYAEVTGSGFQLSFGFYLIIIIFSAGLIITGLWIKDAPLTIFGSFGLYFLGFYVLFNGILGIRDLTTTWAIGLIILGVAFYVSVRSAYELIVD